MGAGAIKNTVGGCTILPEVETRLSVRRLALGRRKRSLAQLNLLKMSEASNARVRFATIFASYSVLARFSSVLSTFSSVFSICSCEGWVPILPFALSRSGYAVEALLIS